MPTIDDLKMFQALPLDIKTAMTKVRIREWINYFGTDGVYVSFSGGKDSTVLLHLVREIYPDVEAVFVDTGLEYPEIKDFVRTFDNVIILRPEKSFKQVICDHGYPIISKDAAKKIYAARRGENWATKYFDSGLFYNGKTSRYCLERYKPLLNVDFMISHKCCDVMKKAPAHSFERKTGKIAIVATMTEESSLRRQAWLQTGCNAFDSKHRISKPMSFWTEQDVLQYIRENDLPIASVYGEIVETGKGGQVTFGGCGKLCTTGQRRTGCIFCGFGAHIEKESRFKALRSLHPKLYDYCIGGGAYGSDGIWRPDSSGLGMGHVFDVLNSIYGDGFIDYK